MALHHWAPKDTTTTWDALKRILHQGIGIINDHKKLSKLHHKKLSKLHTLSGCQLQCHPARLLENVYAQYLLCGSQAATGTAPC